jgi:hypothetical protein
MSIQSEGSPKEASLTTGDKLALAAKSVRE